MSGLDMDWRWHALYELESEALHRMAEHTSEWVTTLVSRAQTIYVASTDIGVVEECLGTLAAVEEFAAAGAARGVQVPEFEARASEDRPRVIRALIGAGAQLTEAYTLELDTLVERYALWLSLLADADPDLGHWDMLLLLMLRDQVEALLQAGATLQDYVQPSQCILDRVGELDATLCQVIVPVWHATMPDWPGDERELLHPRAKWWWWLDDQGADWLRPQT